MIEATRNGNCMVLIILHDSSEHGAHIWSKSGIPTCLRHLIITNVFISPKKQICHHACAAYSELPSDISSTQGAEIVYDITLNPTLNQGYLKQGFS